METKRSRYFIIGGMRWKDDQKDARWRHATSCSDPRLLFVFWLYIHTLPATLYTLLFLQRQQCLLWAAKVLLLMRFNVRERGTNKSVEYPKCRVAAASTYSTRCTYCNYKFQDGRPSGICSPQCRSIRLQDGPKLQHVKWMSSFGDNDWPEEKLMLQLDRNSFSGKKNMYVGSIKPLGG